jgi:hypothetical protein
MTTDELEERLARLEALAEPPPVVSLQSIPPARVAAGELITSAWGNNVVDSLVQRFATLAALKASALPVGALGIVMNDSRWGVLYKAAAGWIGSRSDIYNGTTDSAGRITLTMASFGFSTVNFVQPSMSLQFGTDIVGALPFVRVSGANLEFYFFKVQNDFTVHYDASKAVSFTVLINGTLTP